MGFIGKVSGADFQAHVKAAAADGISPAEFKALKKEWDSLWGLAQYGQGSWMAGEYPELGGALRDKDVNNGWATYQAVGGTVQKE